MNCYSISKITIPDNIVNIDKITFYGCKSLIDIDFSKNIETIGKDAFYECISLVEVILPNKLETIGESAFKKCSNLTTLYVPKSVNEIKEFTFDEVHADFKLYVEKDSYAQTYAIDNNINFVLVDENGNELADETIEPTEKNVITSLPTDEIQSDAVEQKSSYVYILYILIAIAVIFGIIMIILKKRNSK